MKSLQDLKDELLELEILAAGKQIEIAQAYLDQRGAHYFYFKGERDHWQQVMRMRIGERSAAQIARMEAAKGLQL